MRSMTLKSKENKPKPLNERVRYFFGTDAGLITGLVIIGTICFSFGYYVSEASSNKEISKINNEHKDKLNEYEQIVSEKDAEIYKLRDNIYNLRERILKIQELSIVINDTTSTKKYE